MFSSNSKLRKIGSVWLFVLPAFIPLMVFWIYPILKSLYISFTDWDYMSPTYNFVFFDNFIKLFKDSRFYEALGTTVWFSIFLEASYSPTKGLSIEMRSPANSVATS